MSIKILNGPGIQINLRITHLPVGIYLLFGFQIFKKLPNIYLDSKYIFIDIVK